MADKVQHTIRAVVELDEAVNFGDLPNAIQVIKIRSNVSQTVFVYQCSYSYNQLCHISYSLPRFM